MASLFKYINLDKYSFENFEKRQLYCQHYEAFNDPFECWAIIKNGIPDPTIDKERYEEVINLWCPGARPDDEDTVNYMDEILSYEIPTMAFVDCARISCFSNSHNNALMWAHYGWQFVAPSYI